MTLRVSPDEIVANSSSPLLRIADHWARVPLGAVADITNGAAFKSAQFNTSGIGMPLIRIRDVGSANTKTFYDGDYEPRHVVQPDDLLVGMDGDFRVARWHGPTALLNQRVCRIDVRDEALYDARFLEFVVQPYLDAVHELTSAVTVKHLSSRTIGELPIPLPSLPEQRRIVAAIEEHLSRLDAAEDGVRRVSERIGGFGRQMLSEILGVRSTPSLDDDMPTEPLPAGWAWMRAGEVCAGVVSGSTPKAFEMTQGDGDVPFIKVYNVQFDGSLDFSIKPTFVTSEVHRSKLKRSVVTPGDVLTNIVGPPLGKMSIVPITYPEWNINQAIAAFKPSAKIDGPFLSRLMLADVVTRPLLRTGKATAGQINLSISSCRRLWLPVPPIGEQRRLVSEIDAALSLCDQLHRESRLAQSRSRSLRRSILAAALSGRLVPQDPSDEPASVLLERIAAKRAPSKPSHEKKAAS